jgi:acetate kinase
MSVLSINTGSSSVKFALFENDRDDSLCEGEIAWASGEGKQAKLLLWSRNGQKTSSAVSVKNVQAATALGIKIALESGPCNAAGIKAVGHRIVHGGTQLQESVRINGRVKTIIKKMGQLAPLHNPVALKAITTAEKILPRARHVAVFDTSFFKHLPPKRVVYPLPYEYYTEWGIRRFGFHGLSHAYCTRRAAELLKRPVDRLNLIICHLGSGCSAAAVQRGTAVATTLGFSPLDGLMMGTRPGSLDPGILVALQQQGMSLKKIESDLNHASGLLGVSGISPNLAYIEKAAKKGNKRAQLAFDIFVDKVRTAIGGLAVALGKVDALIFTDRFGEGSSAMRAAVCEGLGLLNLRIDSKLNQSSQPDEDVATTDSPGRILVIHTREELVIAREAMRVAYPGEWKVFS